jgi:hypothetical protein
LVDGVCDQAGTADQKAGATEIEGAVGQRQLRRQPTEVRYLASQPGIYASGVPLPLPAEIGANVTLATARSVGTAGSFLDSW